MKTFGSHSNQLHERQKELSCIYALARLLTEVHPPEECAETVAATVRHALSAPESARVRVRLGEVEAVSAGSATEHAANGDTTDGVAAANGPTAGAATGKVATAGVTTDSGAAGDAAAGDTTTGDTTDGSATVASDESRHTAHVFAEADDTDPAYSGELEIAYPPERLRNTAAEATLLDHEREMADAVAALLGNSLRRRRDEESLRTAITAEQRKTVALEEVLGQVEQLRRRDCEELRAALDAEVLPILARLEEFLHEPAQRALTGVLRRTLDNLGGQSNGTSRSLRTKLSPREQEIAHLIASGMSTKQIADALAVSGSTVERHRHGIRRKLGISKKRVNLVTYLRGGSEE